MTEVKCCGNPYACTDGEGCVVELSRGKYSPAPKAKEVRADGGCLYCEADQGESHRPGCTKPALPSKPFELTCPKCGATVRSLFEAYCHDMLPPGARP